MRPAVSTLKRLRDEQRGVTMIEVLITMIILGIVSTMIVGIWISLQHSFYFTQSDNTAATTARTAIDRMTSELRDAQAPNTSTTSPFCLTLSSPYVCDSNDITFYSPYNNPAAAGNTNNNTTGIGAAVLQSIYLDTSGTSPEKKLYWVRDTNGNGVIDSGDTTVLLASNVVNTSSTINKPVFQYILHASPNASFVSATSLSSTNVSQVVAVNIELVVDAQIHKTPTYMDLVYTVRPRNVASN